MPHEWDEPDDEVAAGAICPVPDCGALAVAYRSTETAQVPAVGAFVMPVTDMRLIEPNNECRTQQKRGHSSC
jgi:hypothetical protein